ncbi:hypothetical protein [Pandoraea sp. CB10b_02]|uniref:hypothetical protein n=1 Tax=Pandoraea sp. CB10b_02 TaxID=2014535 RepID=UPI00257E1740|nr:hypothetical protein [Pandoraea sp. CB10b_02]
MGDADVENVDAKRYLTEAIDTHKKWALVQQTKVAALSKGDIDTVMEMREQADKLAMQEALSLSMAFKAIGLPIE